MNVVVLGAEGLLGRHVADEHRGDRVRALGRAQCDITKLGSVLDAVAGADVVYNCAAFTDVDGAESNEQGAYLINAVGAQHAARAAKRHGARFVHVSTDFVFDGAQAEPYDEFATPRPQSSYARSKWAGETLVREAAGDFVIARVQALYGVGGRNFASKLPSLLKAGKALKLDRERRVQPTWAGAAARQLVALGRADVAGTFHVSCSGETTWAAFVKRMIDRLGLRLSVEELSSAELALKAERPPNCLFHHRMLKLHGLYQMPSWQEAMDEFLTKEASS